jgi:hypothetical protein
VHSPREVGQQPQQVGGPARLVQAQVGGGRPVLLPRRDDADADADPAIASKAIASTARPTRSRMSASLARWVWTAMA